MSVNVALQHFHSFLREQVGQKRVYRVLEGRAWWKNACHVITPFLDHHFLQLIGIP
jgi:hypothetical protein